MALKLYDTAKPAGDFPLVGAEDVAYREGRLPDYMPVFLTQEEYDALEVAGEINPKTPYMIVGDDKNEGGDVEVGEDT